MLRHPRLTIVIPALILLGLLTDQYGGPWGQPLVVVATVITFVWIARGGDTNGRVTMALCLLYATIGEVLLSLVWKFYEYRLGNLPLFVPPGHVLLFLLGTQIAPRVSLAAVKAIGAVAVVVIAALALTGRDTLSVALGAVFIASIIFGRDRKLYATMFVLALAMELYGTWLGNWEWHAYVASTGLVTTNPPVAAGAFYAMLDLLVVVSMRALGRPVNGLSESA